MPAKLPVTLQMYTLRDDAARDFEGTLKAVAEIGYAGVELAGYNGLAVEEVKRLLDNNNLIVAGMHAGLDLPARKYAAKNECYSASSKLVY